MAKEQKKSKRISVSRYYKISGDKIERINKFCPKCGVGVFMAKHKNRISCGKCCYMEKI